MKMKIRFYVYVIFVQWTFATFSVLFTCVMTINVNRILPKKKKKDDFLKSFSMLNYDIVCFI